MPAIHVACPTCTQKLSSEPEMLRARMECPRCGSTFVPIEVIPRDTALPALPATRGAPAAQPVSPAAKPSPLAGQVKTIVMMAPGKTDAAAAPVAVPVAAPVAAAAAAPVSAPVSAAAPAPVTVAAPVSAPVSAPVPVSAAAPVSAPVSAPVAAPAPVSGAAAVSASAPGSIATPAASAAKPATTVFDPSLQHQPLLRRPSPSRRASSIIEIRSVASSLLPPKGKKVPWSIGYGHIAGASSVITGLSLIVLALTEPGVIRVLAGIVTAAALLTLLASLAGVLLLRWRPAGEPVSAAGPQAAKPGISGISREARWVLASGAIVMIGLSAAATWGLASATAQLGRAAPPPASVDVAEDPVAAQRADHKLQRSGRAPVSGGVLYIPPAFESSDGAFDVVMHFHGNTELVKESIEAAKINALIYIVNLGIGSGAYEERWLTPGLFDETLDRIRTAVEKRGLRDPKLRRVALSSWSAGYGAVWKILDVKKNFERVDAVMLLDGLHASFTDEKNKTGVDPAKLEPFIRFAKAAAEGKVLMTITHSEIKTTEYASTTATADVLLKAVGASRAQASDVPAKVTMPSTIGVVPKESQQWLTPTTEARVGGLHVRGFTGQTPEHHMAHLIQMSVTVLPELAERWR